jgi:hypothetical protein
MDKETTVNTPKINDRLIHWSKDSELSLLMVELVKHAPTGEPLVYARDIDGDDTLYLINWQTRRTISTITEY